MPRPRKPVLAWNRRCRECDSLEAVWAALVRQFGECPKCEFPYVPLIWPIHVFAFVQNRFIQGYADDEIKDRLGLQRRDGAPRKGTGGRPRKLTARHLPMVKPLLNSHGMQRLAERLARIHRVEVSPRTLARYLKTHSLRLKKQLK